MYVSASAARGDVRRGGVREVLLAIPLGEAATSRLLKICRQESQAGTGIQRFLLTTNLGSGAFQRSRNTPDYDLKRLLRLLRLLRLSGIRESSNGALRILRRVHELRHDVG